MCHVCLVFCFYVCHTSHVCSRWNMSRQTQYKTRSITCVVFRILLVCHALRVGCVLFHVWHMQVVKRSRDTQIESSISKCVMFYMSLCDIYRCSICHCVIHSQMDILISCCDFTWRRLRETQSKTRSCKCVMFHTSYEDVHSHFMCGTFSGSREIVAGHFPQKSH